MNSTETDVDETATETYRESHNYTQPLMIGVITRKN